MTFTLVILNILFLPFSVLIAESAQHGVIEDRGFRISHGITEFTKMENGITSKSHSIYDPDKIDGDDIGDREEASGIDTKPVNTLGTPPHRYASDGNGPAHHVTMLGTHNGQGINDYAQKPQHKVTTSRSLSRPRPRSRRRVSIGCSSPLLSSNTTFCQRNVKFFIFVLPENMTSQFIPRQHMHYGENVSVPMCLPERELPIQSADHNLAMCQKGMCDGRCRFSGFCCPNIDFNCNATADYADVLFAEEFHFDMVATGDSLLQRKKCMQVDMMFFGYYMIVDYIDEMGKLRACPERQASDFLATSIPVMELMTGDDIVFQNLRCAQLNGFNGTDEWEYLNVSFTCPVGTQVSALNYDFIIDHCTTDITPPTDFRHSCFLKVIDSCPLDDYVFNEGTQNISQQVLFRRDTEQDFEVEIAGADYDFGIATLCSTLYMPITLGQHIYKNPFCALCNGVSQLDDSVCSSIVSMRNWKPQLPNFSLLLSSSEQDVDAWTYQGRPVCSDDSIFLMSSNTCMPKQCVVRGRQPLDLSCLDQNATTELPFIFGDPSNGLNDGEHTRENVGQTTLVFTITVGFHIAFMDDFALTTMSNKILANELRDYNAHLLNASSIPCSMTELSLNEDTERFIRSSYPYTYCVIFRFAVNIHQDAVPLSLFRPSHVTLISTLKDMDRTLGNVPAFITRTVGQQTYRASCGQGRSNFKGFSNFTFVSNQRIRYSSNDASWGTVEDFNIQVHVPELNAIMPLNQVMFQFTEDGKDRPYGHPEQTMYICRKSIIMCDSIRVQNDEYVRLDDSDTQFEIKLLDNDLHLALSLGDDSLLFANGDLQLCNDLLPDYQPNSAEGANLSALHVAEGIISVVGGSLSIVSYIATLAIYALFSDLQNIPGKCLMFLMICMCIGHSCLLLSPLISEHEALCGFIGAVQHFAWLCAMCWMFCIALDLLITFRKWSGRLSASANRFVFYCIGSFGVPSMVVLSYSLAVYYDVHAGFGYGGSPICWLYPAKALLWFYILPICVILLVNHVSFLPTFIGVMRQTWGDASQIASGGNNKERYMKLAESVAVITKMLLLIGFVWLFALLAYAFDSDELKMVFSILGSFQGVFLLLSFGMTSQVKRLWGMRMIKRQTRLVQRPILKKSITIKTVETEL